MSYGQEVQSTLKSGSMPNPYSQHFSMISNKQDMETTVQPVSNSEVKPSSSGQSNQKLPSTLVCTACKKSFPRKNMLSRHLKLHCNLCGILFSRNIQLLRHKWNQHKNIKHNGKVNTKSSKRRNRQKYTKYNETISNNSCIVSPKQSESSLNVMSSIKMTHFERRNIISTSSIYPDEGNDKDIHSFLTSIKQVVLNELRYQMDEKKKMKWFAVVKTVVTCSTQDDFLIATPYFHSDTVLELTANNLTVHIDDAFTKIMDNFTMFTEYEPDYILEKIVYLELDTATYDMI